MFDTFVTPNNPNLTPKNSNASVYNVEKTGQNASVYSNRPSGPRNAGFNVIKQGFLVNFTGTLQPCQLTKTLLVGTFWCKRHFFYNEFSYCYSPLKPTMTNFLIAPKNATFDNKGFQISTFFYLLLFELFLSYEFTKIEIKIDTF